MTFARKVLPTPGLPMSTMLVPFSRNSRSSRRTIRFLASVRLLWCLKWKLSIDSFHFKHHKIRTDAKNRIVRLLDLEFLEKGTSIVLIGNPGVGKTFLAKVIGWRA